MGRRPTTMQPSTKLGAAVIAHRAEQTLTGIAEQLGVTNPTLSRIERGTHRPSYDTALALSRWLGWTVEQVMEAAGQPVEAGG